jgi:hypothetical protein
MQVMRHPFDQQNEALTEHAVNGQGNEYAAREGSLLLTWLLSDEVEVWGCDIIQNA